MEPKGGAQAVHADGLTKDFGSGDGVFDVALDIAPGTIVGLVGPSGSGKTTIVRLMTGVIAADHGELEVLGESPVSFTRATRARIGYMPQHAILYPDLTLLENLNFAASLYGMPYDRDDRIAEMVEFVQLDGTIDRLPRQASGGEKRRVMLASTLFHGPDLIFLDEPTAGIDPVLRRRFWDRFRELSNEGKTLLVTTQYVGEAAYCDYVAVLAGGNILVYDTPAGLRRAAYGGEQIEIAFTDPPSASHVRGLAAFDTTGKPSWIDNRTARLVVDDAGEAVPAVMEWASTQRLELERAEAFQPEYDDVFVEIVSNHAGSEVEADAR